jgi:hypothetical protein
MKLGWIAVTGPENGAARAYEGLEWIGDLFLFGRRAAQAMLPSGSSGEVSSRRRRSHASERIWKRYGRAQRRRLDVLQGDGGWSGILRFRPGTLSGRRARCRGVGARAA